MCGVQCAVESRRDAHRYRVGINSHQLPVNKPRIAVHTYNADGAMSAGGHSNPDAYYEPNSFGGATDNAKFVEPPLALSGDAARYNHRIGNDDYRQPGDLFRLMSADQQRQLMDNIAAAMDGVPAFIIKRQAEHFYRCDPAYGMGIASRMKVSLDPVAAAE